MAGAFSRMGFGARGMAMGNAMSSINSGNMVSYYNPALPVFQENNFFQASYSFLSLDRSLNFLNFTRRFQFKSKNDTSGKDSFRAAGLSFGLINAGVSKIDGRDNQGIKTGDLNTSENQFFISFSNRFSERLALGIAVKFFYYRLYEEITSSGFGIDLGILYRINNNMNLSLMLSDINSRYKWDTAPIYNEEGNITTDKFPLLKKAGLSYKFNNPDIIASVEYESSGSDVNYLRFGAEYNIYENFFLRAGLDKLNLSNFDMPARPGAGFSFVKAVNGMNLGIDYAFVLEPYSPSDMHILGISFRF